jgi:hypothetical protein
MKYLLVAAAIAASFLSFEARAQERAGSAALGALSGAVVLGPVGAVAGAVIGYTAGPSIARSWGVGRSSRFQTRRATPSRVAARETGAPESRVQDSRAKTLGANAQAVAPSVTPPIAKPSERLPTKNAPPVQGFD